MASALQGELGFRLTTIVEMPRVMTEDEAYRFLADGVLPGVETLTGETANETPPDVGMSEGEARAFLAGIPSITASGFDPEQPRDPEGKWTDKPNVAVDADADEWLDWDDWVDDEDDSVTESAQTIVDAAYPIAGDGELPFDGDTDWSNDQQRAAYDYSDRHYEEINEYLRTGESGELSSANRRTIDTFRDMMRPTGRNVTVFRGVDLEMFGAGTTHENIRQRLLNNVLENKGFTSTSLSRDIVEENYTSQVLMQIQAPKGTRAVYIGDMTANETSDLELALHDGARLFVFDVERSHEHQTILKVQVIP